MAENNKRERLKKQKKPKKQKKSNNIVRTSVDNLVLNNELGDKVVRESRERAAEILVKKKEEKRKRKEQLKKQEEKYGVTLSNLKEKKRKHLDKYYGTNQPVRIFTLDELSTQEQITLDTIVPYSKEITFGQDKYYKEIYSKIKKKPSEIKTVFGMLKNLINLNERGLYDENIIEEFPFRNDIQKKNLVSKLSKRKTKVVTYYLK